MKLEEIDPVVLVNALIDSGLGFGFERTTSDDRAPREVYEDTRKEAALRLRGRESNRSY